VRSVGFLGPALFLAGVVVLVVGVLRGEANVSLVLIFPVIMATGALGGVGIFLLIAAFVVSFLVWPWAAVERTPPPSPGPTEGAPPAGPRANRWGGVAFVGPIPIVFGSDPRMTRAMLILGIGLFIALLVLIGLVWAFA